MHVQYKLRVIHVHEGPQQLADAEASSLRFGAGLFRQHGGQTGHQAGVPGQGCNSIDIWNFTLELGLKLRQGLRTHLGPHFLIVG